MHTCMYRRGQPSCGMGRITSLQEPDDESEEELEIFRPRPLVND